MTSVKKEEIVKKLEHLWPENKAKGILAQMKFKSQFRSGPLSEYKEKFFDGCWLLSPKVKDFFKRRFSFFVHGRIEDKSTLRDKLRLDDLIEYHWRFHRIANFLKKAGIEVFYAIPTGNLFNPSWEIYRYKDEELCIIDKSKFFAKWPGSGRPSGGGRWSDELVDEFLKFDEEELISVLLNELFYTNFIKMTMKKPVADPYDVDGFFLSYSGAVLPVEIKEKFPAQSQLGLYFGIDAGRLLMLLRLCLPNDSNAVYLIREVEKKDRKFVGWKYIMLSEIIATASWNLQRGGKGMGGQETQIVRLPYSHFKQFDAKFLSEDNIEAVKNLPEEMKRIASEYGTSLERFIVSEYGVK